MNPTEAIIKLMSGIAREGNFHLAELECDRSQVERLMASSIGQLCRRCVLICELAASIETATDHQIEQIRATASAMMTDLQFHDMTSQVLQRSRSRMRGIGALLDQLAGAAKSLREQQSEQAIADGIAQTSLSIFSESTVLAARLPRKVEQTSSDAGETILF